MSVEGFTELSAAAIAASVRAGQVSPAEFVRASFERAKEIGAGPDELNIILYADEKASVEEAKEMDGKVMIAQIKHKNFTVYTVSCTEPPKIM